MHRTYLPIVPATALRRHRASEPFDHRFRACARLLQSLWRVERGLPIGGFTRASGETKRLGSMISERAGETGANFLLPEIARLARREVAYREPRALVEERRLWCNLLSSMPLTFNVFGLLKLDTKLATRMVRTLLPSLADATVEAVLFEHSPGRGDITLTADYTAFDVMLTYSRPGGISGFVAVEVKYAESAGEAQKELNPRYAELAPAAGLHKAPDAQALTRGPLQQFYRQHLLAQAMVKRGDYVEGTFMVLAPALNTPVQSTVVRYADQLAEPAADKVAFVSVTLEQFVEHLRQCGHRAYANLLHRRYLDWSRVDETIEQVIADFGRLPTVGNDNTAATREAA
ncbi:MAG: PGN_0703 family putative restriction endonuclease [Sphingomicrobium sp.]